jgi:PhoPQ-activated pathogenicity-related protein
VLRAVVAAMMFTLPAGVVPRAVAGALEDFVKKPDASYQWKARATTNLPSGHAVTHLEMTSQTWREHPWTHHLQVVRPAKVRNPDIAFLFVTGDGSGRSSLPMLATLADRAGAVAVVITRVPNQPLYDGRKEDALIAFTFDQYLKTGDATWPLLFPMVKSAVRGMDTVQAHAKQQHGQNIEKFVVGGASKRGWTTWLTAAADARVTAIAPMVIDMLNMKAQTEWAEKVYGKQSEQIGDYTELQLHKRMDEPRMVELRGWVDPYSYRQRYNLPKLLLLGTNDPFWTVDALRHYWDELPGPKLVFQTPNAGHDLGDRRDAIATLAAFFEMIADCQPLPKMEWTFKNGTDQAEVDVSLNQPAKGIRLFTSDSADRDFRDGTWTSRPLQEKRSQRAVGQVRVPGKGYRAFLAEVTLTSPSGHDYKLSTEARVAPDGVR